MHSTLPVIREIPLGDPVRALRALAALPHAFLLHSALRDERARWSYFGADPFEVLRGDEAIDAPARWRAVAELGSADREHPGAAPFTGGAVGYWSYDYGRRLERLPAIARDDLGLPDALVGFYDVVGAFDHDSRRAWLFSSGLPLEGSAARARAGERLAEFATRLARHRPEPHARPVPRAPGALAIAAGPPVSTFTPDAYRRAVEDVKERIRSGELFQANLSQRWTAEWSQALGSPAALDAGAIALHEALVRHSPAPHAACLLAGDHAIVSASPERFLELRGQRVETRPIKGTRPRGGDASEDARLAAELLASAKDRAENVMIVDVMRNDLGRVCLPGSVSVPKLCELEAFPQVFHLTSTVVGELRDDLGPFDLLHACFPPGSITGAPKIRAMEVIEALEPVRRHAYTGAIGWMNWRGDADWNVAIRTAIVTPRAIHFAAGGGITGDSDPDAEYEETLDKAAGMRVALAAAFGAEAPDAAHAEATPAARTGAGR